MLFFLAIFSAIRIKGRRTDVLEASLPLMYMKPILRIAERAEIGPRLISDKPILIIGSHPPSCTATSIGGRRMVMRTNEPEEEVLG